MHTITLSERLCSLLISSYSYSSMSDYVPLSAYLQATKS